MMKYGKWNEGKALLIIKILWRKPNLDWELKNFPKWWVGIIFKDLITMCVCVCVCVSGGKINQSTSARENCIAWKSSGENLTI